MATLRDADTPPQLYRMTTRRLASVLLAEAVRSLPTREIPVNTPFEGTRSLVIDARIVAVPILRSGLAMLDAAQDLLPDLDVGYLGLERDEKTLEAREYYRKLPPVMGRHVLLLDPMLATGGTASAALTTLKEERPESVRLVGVVAAPEGLKQLDADHPDVDIYLGAIDRELDAEGNIRPGVGDFGDRLFGT